MPRPTAGTTFPPERQTEDGGYKVAMVTGRRHTCYSNSSIFSLPICASCVPEINYNDTIFKSNIRINITSIQNSSASLSSKTNI